MQLPGRTKVYTTVLFIVFLLLSLVIAETFYSLVAPPPVQVAGGTYFTTKAQIYGWAYPPNEPLTSHNPDTGEVTAVFKTNSEGWKDIEHAKTAPDGTYRILVIGDSYTFGIVSLDNLYTRQLARILKRRGYNDVEVITMGLPGIGLDHALVIFENEGADYRPDLVIYQNCENDLYPLMHGMREVAADAIPSGRHMWPFYFKLDDTGGLVKVDLTDRFRSALRDREEKRTWMRAMIDFLSNRTLVYYAVRGWDAAHAWYLTTFAEPVQVVNPLQPVFGNIGESDRRRQVEIDEENLAQYKKNYKDQVNAMLQLTRKIREGKSDRRIMYLNPSEDPFVYRKGNLTGKDTEAWRLMEALLLRLKTGVDASGGRLVIFSEDGEDEAKKAYYRSVGNVKTIDGADRALWDGRWLDFDWNRGILELRKIGERTGIPVVPRRRPYPRFLYDNHTNIEGNRNMALDIADFLETYPPFREKAKRVAP